MLLSLAVPARRTQAWMQCFILSHHALLACCLRSSYHHYIIIISLLALAVEDTIRRHRFGCSHMVINIIDITPLAIRLRWHQACSAVGLLVAKRIIGQCWRVVWLGEYMAGGCYHYTPVTLVSPLVTGWLGHCCLPIRCHCYHYACRHHRWWSPTLPSSYMLTPPSAITVSSYTHYTLACHAHTMVCHHCHTTLARRLVVHTLVSSLVTINTLILLLMTSLRHYWLSY